MRLNQRADEFLDEWKRWLKQDNKSPDMSYLKDRNREMIILFLEKVKETRDKRYISYLTEWAKVDYKKVKIKIYEVIKALEENSPIDPRFVVERDKSVKEALEGASPEEFHLKCHKCGEYFAFTVGEQKFYKQRGYVLPKTCNECRDKRNESNFLW
ncbi:MAG: zinc-ribbon domain-containing protein [Bacillaceae bacterium]|nr:zinc-ribbon domain-containing protein [Bacillaceae bacterium]